MNPEIYHEPVMLHEVEEYLIVSGAGTYVDCTCGGGGHSAYLLAKYPAINIVAVDWDEAAIDELRRKLGGFSERVRIIRDNFGNIKHFLQDEGVGAVDGVLADLGLSSRQLEDKSRGFSFLSPGLDMRMDARLEENAMDLVNRMSEDDLSDICFRLGEERFSRRISRRIAQERAKKGIASRVELAEIVERAIGRRGKIHPATRVFQALRIAVNHELDNLLSLLESLPSVLRPGGRAVVLSYHSLEDRMVKQSFKKYSQENVYKLLTKKIVLPSPEEAKINPRSRSAKLRAVERL